MQFGTAGGMVKDGNGVSVWNGIADGSRTAGLIVHLAGIVQLLELVQLAGNGTAGGIGTGRWEWYSWLGMVPFGTAGGIGTAGWEWYRWWNWYILLGIV